MKIRKTISAAWVGILWLLLLTGLSGCGLLPKHYGNTIIPENNLNALKTGGPHEDTWSTEDVILNYRYTQKAGQLTISGTIDLVDSLKSYDKLDYLDFWIYFTNSENKIIGQLLISPITFFNQVEETAFEKTYTLPPDAKAIVFSYRGSVSESGSGGDGIRDGGTTWVFWKAPHG